MGKVHAVEVWGPESGAGTGACIGTSALFGWDGRYWWHSCNSHSLASLAWIVQLWMRDAASKLTQGGKWRPTPEVVYIHTHTRWERQRWRWRDTELADDQCGGVCFKIRSTQVSVTVVMVNGIQLLKTEWLDWELKTCLSFRVYKR